MDLRVFSKFMVLQLHKGDSLWLTEFKDHPAKPISERSCQTQSKHHDK